MAGAVDVKNETTYEDYEDSDGFGDEEDMFMMDNAEYDTLYDDFPVNQKKMRNKAYKSSKKDKRNLIDDQNMLNLKNPPVYTERTVSLISASAPQGEFENFMKASLKNVVSQKPNSPSKSSIKPKKPLEISEFQLNQNINNNTNNYFNNNINNNINNNFPSYNIRIRENFFEGENTNLLKVIGDEDNVIGSLPPSKFMEQIILRSAREKSEGKDVKKTTPVENSYGKFITIPTISFTNILSPEAPHIEIGTPQRAIHRILITAGVHGDEPCGIIAFNELLSEGYFRRLPAKIHVCSFSCGTMGGQIILILILIQMENTIYFYYLLFIKSI